MYQTLTIKQILEDLNRKYFLPAIQREFVWDETKIKSLFDSILRGYPIGSFLFWRVNKQNISRFEFYEFIRDYHKLNNRHNKKANLNGYDEIEAILDGQQRLTSLYIGLKGSYATKIPYRREDDHNAYPQKKLYINLISMNNDNDDIENKYELEFLEKPVNDEQHYWYEVSQILNLEFQNINNFISEKKLSPTSSMILSNLCWQINTPIINYFLESSNELHKVLNIFVRVNSGGEPLSYSDLLLSIATASWKSNAREEIYDFVDETNNIGNRFSINKDFILKSSLFLLDKDVKFKIDNFNLETMQYIEKNWENIKNSLKITYELLRIYGFNSQNLLSNYPATIIAYYIFKNNIKSNDLHFSPNYFKVREETRKFVILSLLKQTFSSSLDTMLVSIRKSLNQNQFVLNDISKALPANKRLDFNEDEINDFLLLQYGKAQTFLVLSLLYPNLDLKNYFHIDHIFPKSKFNKNSLKSILDDETKIEEWKKKANCLGNLQLLEGQVNIQKQDKMPNEWIIENFNNNEEQIKEYKNKNYINPELKLDFDNFEVFIKDRENRIKSRMKEILQKRD